MFNACKTPHNDDKMMPDNGEWISQHGAVEPVMVKVDLMLVSCPRCSAKNVPKMGVTRS